MMVIQTITVRKKGQITLPAEIRKDLGIEEGDQIFITKRDGEYAITTATLIVDRTAGALKHYVTEQRPLTIEDMDNAVAEGISESWTRFVRETEAEYDQ